MTETWTSVAKACEYQARKCEVRLAVMDAQKKGHDVRAVIFTPDLTREFVDRLPDEVSKTGPWLMDADMDSRYWVTDRIMVRDPGVDFQLLAVVPS